MPNNGSLFVLSSYLTKLNFAAEAEARTQFVEEETTKSEHNMIRGNPNRFGPLSTYMPGRAVIR